MVNDDHADRVIPEHEVSFVIRQFLMSAYTSHQGTSVTQKRVPQLNVSVKAAMLVSDIPRSFHVYIVVISTDFGVWTVHRRFSQFLELHHYITRGHKQFPATALTEIFPPKKFFLNPSTKVAKKRIEELHNYMQALLASPAAYELRFWNFLGVISFARHFVPSHPLPQTLVTPSLIAQEFLHTGERNIAVTFVEFSARLLRSVVTRDGNAQPVTKGVVLPTLREMIVMLIHTGRMSFTSFTLSLLYVKQIRDLRGKHSIRGSPHLLLIAALIVTAKFLYDEPPHPIVNNWFTPREIWHMELKILTGIQFNLNVSEEVYSTFVNRMDKSICKHFLSGDLDMQNQKQIEAKQHNTWADQPLFGGEGTARRLGTWIYLSDNNKQHTADDIAQQRKVRTAPTSPVPSKSHTQQQQQQQQQQHPQQADAASRKDTEAKESKPILRSPSYDNLSDQLLSRRGSGVSLSVDGALHNDCARTIHDSTFDRNGAVHDSPFDRNKPIHDGTFDRNRTIHDGTFGRTGHSSNRHEDAEGEGSTCVGDTRKARAVDNTTENTTGSSVWSEECLSAVTALSARAIAAEPVTGGGKDKMGTTMSHQVGSKSPLPTGSVWGCDTNGVDVEHEKSPHRMKHSGSCWSDDQLSIQTPSDSGPYPMGSFDASVPKSDSCRTRSKLDSATQDVKTERDVR